MVEHEHDVVLMVEGVEVSGRIQFSEEVKLPEGVITTAHPMKDVAKITAFAIGDEVDRIKAKIT